MLVWGLVGFIGFIVVRGALTGLIRRREWERAVRRLEKVDSFEKQWGEDGLWKGRNGH